MKGSRLLASGRINSPRPRSVGEGLGVRGILNPRPLLNKGIKQMSAQCPECEGTIALAADILDGEIVPCPDCGAELEVVSLNPVVLELAPEVEEDWGE